MPGWMLWVDENLREVQPEQGMQIPDLRILVDTSIDQKVDLQEFKVNPIAGKRFMLSTSVYGSNNNNY